MEDKHTKDSPTRVKTLKTPPVSIETLPNEITGHILTFVDDESVPPCRFVCRLWNDSLHNRPVLRGVDLFVRLAAVGRLAVLQWAVEHCSRVPLHDTRICDAAAEGGHLDVLKWLRENGCLWGKDTCSNDAKGGHLDELNLLRETGCPCIKESDS